MHRTHNQKGMTLVTCLIFMVVLLALGSSLASLSGSHVQVSANQQRAARALAGAESGVEVMRYWLGQVVMDATTPPAQYLRAVVNLLQSELAHAEVSNLVLGDNGVLSTVSLNDTTGQSFAAQLSINDADPAIVDLTVTGSCGGMDRTIRVSFQITPYEHPIFNYGLATRGPVLFLNNPTMTTVTGNWEADIYTESSDSAVAVYVGGDTNFDGNIRTSNPRAAVSFGGDVQIAGDTGQAAIDNHVTIGAAPVEFPVADTGRFVPYATGPVVDPCTMDLTKGITLTNATIPAGTNPTFDGTVIVEGVLLVEQPNIVTFNRNVELRGIMVGENGVHGAGGSQISIGGNFASVSVPNDSQFDALRPEKGSSIITPGFEVSFTGNYSAIEGVVAAGNLHFGGHGNAIVKGSLISFSDSPTVVEGNVSLTFDRANSTRIPAGFDTKRILVYDPASYALVCQTGSPTTDG